jgi:hypothetical protein
MRLLLTCLLLGLALPAAAQIYKYTDANGNTVFTNQPPEGVATQNIELPPTNTVEMQVPTPAPADTANQTNAGPAYKVLELTGLPDDEALRANNGTFSVNVRIEPRLAPGHSLRLLLDGKPYGQPSNVPRLQLTEVARGEHSLAVEVLRGGEPIQQSNTHTFTVQRVHLGTPPPPPAKPKPAT